MLDIKFIRQNPKLVSQKIKQRGLEINLDKLLDLDKIRRELIEKIDRLRRERKEAASKRDDKKGTKIKGDLRKLENEYEEINLQFSELLLSIPNVPADDVPIGESDKDNVVMKTWGETGKTGKNHVDLGQDLNLIDIESAAKVSGSRFSYLKNEAVILEFALIKYVFDLLSKENFNFLIPPVFIKGEVMRSTGYVEHRDQTERYFLKEDNQYLVGSSEQSIVSMHADETIPSEKLPLRYAGFSTCFRREAGSYGKDVKGIFRLHQFDKVEMVSFCHPKDSKEELKYLVSLEEKIIQGLKLPYRLVSLCTADIAFPLAKTIDLEIWMPGQNKYRETHSASTATDFQARRLNIKYRDNSSNDYLHTLNATAIAIGRMLIAILENYQQKDGSVEVPKVLHEYTGFTRITPKRNS